MLQTTAVLIITRLCASGQAVPVVPVIVARRLMHIGMLIKGEAAKRMLHANDRAKEADAGVTGARGTRLATSRTIP